jgi:hypothetical protein
MVPIIQFIIPYIGRQFNYEFQILKQQAEKSGCPWEQPLCDY